MKVVFDKVIFIFCFWSFIILPSFSQKMTKKEQNDVLENFSLLEKSCTEENFIGCLLFLPEYRKILYPLIDTSRIEYHGYRSVLDGKRLIPTFWIIENLTKKERKRLITTIKEFIIQSYSHADYSEKFNRRVIDWIFLSNFLDYLLSKELSDNDWLYEAFVSYPKIKNEVSIILKEYGIEHFSADHIVLLDFNGQVAAIAVELSTEEQLAFCKYLIDYLQKHR